MLKPAPISISGATLPRTSTVPERRRIDPRQQSQQSTLAGSVAADDADALAMVDLRVDIPQRPELRDRNGRFAAQTRSNTARLNECPLSA